MDSRQQPQRGRRRRLAALAGVTATILAGGLALADPAAAVGPYATSTASPPSSTAPPASGNPRPADPYTYSGSSLWWPYGYWYPY